MAIKDGTLMRASCILFIVQWRYPWQVGGGLHSGQDLHHQDQEWHQNTGISSSAAGGHWDWGQGQTRECWERTHWLQTHHTTGWLLLGYDSVYNKSSVGLLEYLNEFIFLSN